MLKMEKLCRTWKHARITYWTTQATILDRPMLLYIRIGNLLWFGVSSHIAMNILSCKLFVDHFIQNLFLAEHMVVPWYSPPVATISRNIQKKTPNTQDMYYPNPNKKHRYHRGFILNSYRRPNRIKGSKAILSIVQQNAIQTSGNRTLCFTVKPRACTRSTEHNEGLVGSTVLHLGW